MTDAPSSKNRRAGGRPSDARWEQSSLDSARVEVRDFACKWQIERTIEDHRTKQRSQFTGHVAPHWQGDHLIWTETGTLSHPSGQFEATQTYHWRQVGEGVAIHFPDGRLYHVIGQTTLHVCDPDTYQIAYDFTSWPRWAVTTTVNGPRKDYTIKSLYSSAKTVSI